MIQPGSRLAADEHLWAGKYSGKLEDIFEIQEQISRRTVDALKMRLSPEEDKKLADGQPPEVGAIVARGLPCAASA